MAFRKVTLLAAAILVLGSLTASAESSPPGGDPAHHFSRADMCTEFHARSAAHWTYVEVKLNLTPEQEALWAKWRDSLAPGEQNAHKACLQHAAQSDTHSTFVDREAHVQQMLAAKAASLQAAQPALETLYASLNTDQKGILDESMSHHRHGHDGHGEHHGEWSHHSHGCDGQHRDEPPANP